MRRAGGRSAGMSGMPGPSYLCPTPSEVSTQAGTETPKMCGNRPCCKNQPPFVPGKYLRYTTHHHLDNERDAENQLSFVCAIAHVISHTTECVTVAERAVKTCFPKGKDCNQLNAPPVPPVCLYVEGRERETEREREGERERERERGGRDR